MNRNSHVKTVIAMAAIITAGCTAQDGAVAPSQPPAVTGVSTPSPQQPRAGMVLIPAGSYPLGRNDGPAEERPAHQVTIKPYYIDAYPVTTQQFVDWANGQTLINARGGDRQRWDGPLHPAESDAVRDQSGREIFTTDDSDDDSRIVRRDGRFAVEDGFADHPVNEVYWWGAHLYCQARGARLLTEAEWEAAARGAEGRTYPWGNDEPDASRAQFGKRYGETSPVTAHPRGATPQGVYDLAGNLYEWTSSLDRPYPYAADDGREDVQSRDLRITRGGAHDERAANMRSTDRDGYSRDPFAGHHHIGFRCGADG
ncbi:formylglycine-generating enzyme family protein [Kibdelosporangium aridum]|uniref:formylglycine-generating enzyme family protein n=1 Tax=Kibdelosporangium aridum TaxID=2030 RepID=UPI00052624A7